ncbi:EAL domain-containing protein [Actinoplanes sp. NPDC026670]|uniref:putative bifunctional diguanylate cyclase/phosphodiesterase n=1 Tax=Actinoplanes sp. NPDC026670 TaxID=3154700 RepID=UPI0033F6BD56
MYTVICVLADTGSAAGDSDLAVLLANIVYLGPAVLAAAGARRTAGPVRRVWWLLAAGMLAYAAGNSYWYLRVRYLDPVPAATLSDLLWLAFYPCCGVALILLLHHRLPRLGAAAWLDGAIAAGAVSALVSAPLLATVPPSPQASIGEVLVNVAYPLSDVAVAGCLLGAWALCGWHADRAMLRLITGMAVFATADVVSMVTQWRGTEAPTSLDLLWVGGLTLLALAPSSPDRHSAVTRSTGGTGSSTAVPAVLAFLCLGLLAVDAFSDRAVAPVSGLLATAAIGATIIRMMVSVRTAAALSTAHRQARTDDLTGLANRRHFVEQLDDLLATGAGGSLAVALLDLDRFKEVNDSFGHDVGDNLLTKVAARLRTILPEHVLLARLGGDEFGLLMPDTGRARRLATEVHTVLRDPFVLPEVDLHADASIGVAVFPDDGADRPTLLRRADVAMYAAKAGHGGVAFATGLDDQARSRLTLLEELRSGIGRGELVLHYQPKVAVTSDRRVCGVEALVRWQHPTRGLVYPDEFLPVAENAGLIASVTTAVLDLACRQSRAWRDQGLPVSVAVNLSVSDLRDPLLPQQIAGLLHRYRLPATALDLEVTESVLMTDADTALSLLSTLRSMGIRIAVDDYGTGYSSLTYLQMLPVDDLKLDRAFVSRCGHDSRSAAIVQSTVQLAHSLGMRIIAEGVEDDDIFTQLHRYGCDLAQGYGIARPQNADVTTAWLRRQSSTDAVVTAAAHD